MRWQSLEELAGDPEFQQFLLNEFPQWSALHDGVVDRREFLAAMAASLGLAGLTACSPPAGERIVPYVEAPEELVPGRPLFYATAMPMGGYGTGLIVESHMGRPTKVEGNPGHPASLGATDAFAQASVLTLYDPDRSQVVRQARRIATWEALFSTLTSQMALLESRQGRGLRILTETVTSPTLAWQIGALLERFPEAAWHQYEPVGFDNARAASQQSFGRYLDPRYRLERAAVIVALDADFLSWMPGHVRYTRDFAQRRQAADGRMNRLYALESVPSLTGAMADHRAAVRSSDIAGVVRALAGAIEGGSPSGAALDGAWIEAVARDLAAHRGESLVLAGPWQPPEVHILAAWINARLGNIGSTVEFIEPVEARPADQTASLRALVEAMQAGSVDLLLILGGNPVYTAPADFEFGRHLQNVRLRVHSSLYEDETSELCQWHSPEAHYLESWSDVRAFDGSAAIVQPLIDPLYGGKTSHEILSVLLGEPERSGYDIVRGYWQQAAPRPDFEAFWRRALHDGVIEEGRAAVAVNVSAALPDLSGAAASPPAGLELAFRPDPSIFDGRFANNSWLQELPKPLTKLTWDNVVYVSPRTAIELGLANEDVVEVQHDGRSLQGPVWVMPGHADGAITVFLGYGRRRAGRVGGNRGYDAYSIRTSAAPWIAHGVSIRNTGSRYALASTQHHHAMADRHLVRSASIAEYSENPDFARRRGEDPSPAMSLYPEHAAGDYAWGMSIDLNACVGCNACVVACQAENNIPVVGKTEVIRGREMQWMRIDRYYEGPAEDPATYFQPMLCQHCENAPCEPVCPVAATTHSAEGLNEMTYNRCIGTRYCSNNCPYKVRRFNFFQYAVTDEPSLKLLHNPDVTVRSRGVMEKCTYCVQRINAARIEAKKEGRPIRDGEIVTACQSVCPADAIVFGNTLDAASRVARMKAEPRSYGVLSELGTRPRTTYLAKLTNPNSEL